MLIKHFNITIRTNRIMSVLRKLINDLRDVGIIGFDLDGTRGTRACATMKKFGNSSEVWVPVSIHVQ